MKLWWLAVLLTGCTVYDVTESALVDEGDTSDASVSEGPEVDGVDRFNPCLQPAGTTLEGVSIPVACYAGPPRHDDVESVVSPMDLVSDPQLDVQSFSEDLQP